MTIAELKPITVGDLKKALLDVPDDIEIVIEKEGGILEPVFCLKQDKKTKLIVLKG